MSVSDQLDRIGIEEYLEHYRNRDLLRLLTCGSVDDGKSTLIGRLLHDSKMVFDDVLNAARLDTAKYGNVDGEIDFSLLVDGLQAEREQGITIDVAYRYFATEKRKFIIADTPGHVQYTRNMATGASTSNLAIILIDARKGVLEQTRRHTFIASLLGIQHLVVAVNKMDLVDYDESVFDVVKVDFKNFATKLQTIDVHFIPISALKGDNIINRSEKMGWFQGALLMDHLESVHIASDSNLIDLRFSVQNVFRPNHDLRCFAGTVISGVIRERDEVVALPSGKRSRVKSIITYDGELPEAFAPMAVSLALEDEIDISRGDTLTHINNAPILQNTFDVMIVWMGDTPLEVGKGYLLKHCSLQTGAVVDKLRYRINISTLHRENATTLNLNEIGRVQLECNQPIACDSYSKNRGSGALILIDRITNATVAAGMVVARISADEILHRRKDSGDAQTNLRSHIGLVTPAERLQRLRQRPVTIWFIGLPRSGKSSIAKALERALFDIGLQVHVLHGESLRNGLNSDLGFSGADRWENQRRAAEVARLSNEIGLICIVSTVSPLKADREQAKRIVGGERFLTVYCNAPLSVCEDRDTVGLYKKARAGEIRNVTGIDAPFEPPGNAEILLDTDQSTISDCVQTILRELRARELIKVEG